MAPGGISRSWFHRRRHAKAFVVLENFYKTDFCEIIRQPNFLEKPYLTLKETDKRGLISSWRALPSDKHHILTHTSQLPDLISAGMKRYQSRHP